MLGGDHGFHFRASIMFPEDAAVECPKEPPQVASPRCLPRKLPKQDAPYKTLGVCKGSPLVPFYYQAPTYIPCRHPQAPLYTDQPLPDPNKPCRPPQTVKDS